MSGNSTSEVLAIFGSCRQNKSGAIYLSLAKRRQILDIIKINSLQSPFSRYLNKRVSVMLASGTTWTGHCSDCGKDYIVLSNPVQTFMASQICWVKPAK